MEAVRSPEMMLDFYRTTRRYNPEDHDNLSGFKVKNAWNFTSTPPACSSYDALAEGHLYIQYTNVHVFF